MTDDRLEPIGRRFQVLEALGQGAFGTVYRARMLGEGAFVKEVALKLLRTDLEGEKADHMARRNRDEARLLGLVRHRAVLHVDGLVRLDGRWAVVMELVDGCNLKDLIRHGTVPPAVAIAIVGEVAGGLAAAYDATAPDGAPLRLVHRDVKPANLQLSRTGDVKLLDFGVARAQFDGREAETQGMMLGTLRYMSPERFDGVDGPEGDVYALGVVLAELLTREPVAKTSGNRERHEATVSEALARVRQAMPDAPDPDPLVALLARMLSYDPAARPAARGVEQVTWDLRRTWAEPRLPDFAREQIPRVQARVRPTDTDPLIGGVLSESSAQPPDRRSTRWSSMVGWGAVLALFLLSLLAVGVGSAGLAAVWMSRSTPSAPPSAVDAPAEAAEDAGPEPRPPPEPEPEPAPTAAPDAPPVAEAPTPPAPPPPPAPERTAGPHGTVRVTGDAVVTLVGDGERHPPGPVPVGSWEVRAVFGGRPEEGFGTVEVRNGRTVDIICVAAFRMCKVRAPL